MPNPTSIILGQDTSGRDITVDERQPACSVILPPEAEDADGFVARLRGAAERAGFKVVLADFEGRRDVHDTLGDIYDGLQHREYIVNSGAGYAAPKAALAPLLLIAVHPDACEPVAIDTLAGIMDEGSLCRILTVMVATSRELSMLPTYMWQDRLQVLRQAGTAELRVGKLRSPAGSIDCDFTDEEEEGEE